jgi:hypothetical protein
MAFLSQAGILRQYGIEFLSHKPAHVRMARWIWGAPFLFDEDPLDQRGMIVGGRLRNGKLQGTVMISRTRRGEELWMDLEDGIRRYVGVVYILHHLRELKREEKSIDLQQACDAFKCGAFISEDWEPVAGSSIAIPHFSVNRSVGG